MSIRDRKKKPSLSRTQPIRDWSKIFTMAASAPRSESPRDRTSPTAGDSRHPNEETPPASFEAAAVRSVEIGYRVVDEYMRRGQQAARRMRSGTYGGSELVRDSREIADRMIRSASDVVSAWGELLELTADGADRSPDPGGEPASVEPVDPPVGIVPWRIRLSVDPKYAVDVEIDLESPLEGTEPEALSLRKDGSGTERIENVTFGVDTQNMPTLSVKVRSRHRPGTYTGVLVDGRTGGRIGTLSVTVRER